MKMPQKLTLPSNPPAAGRAAGKAAGKAAGNLPPVDCTKLPSSVDCLQPLLRNAGRVRPNGDAALM
jgi:hypothetical protein